MFISGSDSAWIVTEIGEEEADLIFLRAAQFGQFAALAGVFISMGLAAISPNIPLLLTGVLCIPLPFF